MKYFSIGVLFISLFLPIINGIVSVFQQEIEYLCTKIAVKTIKAEKELKSEQLPQEQTNLIGFHVYNDEYDDEGE